MTVKKRPLLLVGFWLVVMLVGLLGSAIAPSVAVADGGSGDPLPGEGDNTPFNPPSDGETGAQEDERSALDLLIYLILILL